MEPNRELVGQGLPTWPPASPAHTFRHTVCTVQGQAGRDWREIANDVGHKKASMTMDVYREPPDGE